ncbi:hypothetical protein ACHAXM_000150, partial [Skeletonema potamos]
MHDHNSNGKIIDLPQQLQLALNINTRNENKYNTTETEKQEAEMQPWLVLSDKNDGKESNNKANQEAATLPDKQDWLVRNVTLSSTIRDNNASWSWPATALLPTIIFLLCIIALNFSKRYIPASSSCSRSTRAKLTTASIVIFTAFRFMNEVIITNNNDLYRIRITTEKKSEEKIRPCYITVENKADYHYEIIESAIMQFPLPWDTFNCSKEDTIADVALTKHHRFAKNELEPWQKYFETHLAGTTQPRTNGDGAVIHFGSIQNYMNYSHSYDAYIGASCDSFDWLGQLSRGPNQFCILHGTVDQKNMRGRRKRLWEQHKGRVCWVSPMHPCYFIPSDLPQFKPENFRKGDKLRLCLKASASTTSLQYVDEGVKRLRQVGEPNIEIIIMGRSMPIMSSQAFPSISHLVKQGNEPDYYKFEEMMSKCHVLLPLIHPWDDGKKYFPWSGAGKLSGYMSQAIGLKLPLLVHEEIKELYKEHLDAPVWSYTTQNMSDTWSFVDAFGAM